jgi:hypothetical protein
VEKERQETKQLTISSLGTRARNRLALEARPRRADRDALTSLSRALMHPTFARWSSISGLRGWSSGPAFQAPSSSVGGTIQSD